jgi:ParB family chromosome partitioning protein
LPELSLLFPYFQTSSELTPEIVASITGYRFILDALSALNAESRDYAARDRGNQYSGNPKSSAVNFDPSKDLHPLDLAECLLNQIVYRHPELEAERDRIPTILNTFLQRLKRNKQLSELTAIITAPKEEQREWLETVVLKQDAEFHILQALLGYQLNPASISTNVFPMLAIAPDLKEVVRESGLDASKVRELNKLSAEKLALDEAAAAAVRAETARKVATENLSLSETRQLVSALFKTHHPGGSSVRTPSQRAIKNLQTITVEDWQADEIKAFKQALKAKLAELEQIAKAK